jgi:hypothetical protein
MTTFTDAEIEFLNSQRLGRLATVGADGMPWIRVRPRRIVAVGVNDGQFGASARDVTK